ncbi:MAG: prephenate dehydrogenase/arogenate dehydrogenase family protein [Candidatus Margulisiibacteriota bacterium]
MVQVQKVAIIGLGLIGGSLGLALLKRGLAETVVGIPRRAETIDEALALGAITKGTLTLVDGVRNADLVFICTPIPLIIPTLNEILPHLKKGAVVTDVGSTKGWIMEEVEKLNLDGVSFFGGHPMAGKEKTGVLQAEANLFLNRPYVLVKPPKFNLLALNALKKIITGIGGKIMEIDAQSHDLAVAAISHLPIMVAASLVNAVNDMELVRNHARQLASTGFFDTTRVASGDPKLGLDIFCTNTESVLEVLAKFKQEIEVFEKALKERDEVQIVNKLAEAKKFRDEIYS